jgi:small subunit ribosomal protein S3
VGQKVHPYGLRVGFIKPWHSNWFATKKEYANFLHLDIKMRDFIKKKIGFAGISAIDFERAGEKVRIKIYAARPGLIIGKKGSEVDKLRDELQDMSGSKVFIDIHEVKVPEADAQLVAEGIAMQLEKRASFRRTMKKSVNNALNAGVLGIKVSCAGRLGGAEMARTEGYSEGKVPLHTLRADIDYGFAEAYTTFGVIGVKVWIFKGEVIEGAEEPVKVEKKEKPIKGKETDKNVNAKEGKVQKKTKRKM